MNYLNVNHRFSVIDFKMYRSNMITNNGVIDHRQKSHRDYKVAFPKAIINMKKNMKNNK